ncbi:DNA polymerase III subunit alpha [Kocuria sp. JC486]|uniref:DNA polymerase III subunit alpha n=1 Tax=Kocuria sp. JC486 TaxID=1970736 RepID=UPI00141E041A|nr:DNA polymerase III subunit alpha [Kocuria sp. JC486]NHU86285.1 DNA polymerase III subunit alpha [Kocuria sp. JC486]
MPFTHLHVHSGFSAHYGTTSPERLVQLAADQKSSALALTDRDGLYGAVKHVGACHQAGIAPVLGADLAVRGDDGAPLGRVVVLAHGRLHGAGYAALCQAVSAAHAVDTKNPSISRNDLAECIAHGRPLSHGERRSNTGGSSCSGDRPVTQEPHSPHAPLLSILVGPGSDVGRLVENRRFGPARKALEGWMQALPPGCLNIEVVSRLAEPGRPGSVTPATRMLGLAEASSLPAVLTNAVRYGTPDEAVTADLADSTRTLLPLDQVDQLDPTGQAWLKPEPLMHRIARMVVTVGDHQRTAADLLEATERLSERCALDPLEDLGWGVPKMPEASVIGVNGDPMTTLWERARAGVEVHYPRATRRRRREVEDRLAHEMATVEHLGFPSYFLTVARVAEIIRSMGIRIQARGSGVGSVLNYLLGTSGVEPLSNGLLWERFLSPERLSLPDIDLDVESARRHEIYHRLFKEFGEQRVSLMSMTNTYRSRGAVRDAGLALGLPEEQIDRIAKELWRFDAKHFRRALAEKPELGEIAQQVRESEQLDLLVELTQRLDSLPRHISMHPCGVILSDTSLLNRTPVQNSGLGLPMSQFDKHDMDPMGLIKLDILGVRMQSSMAFALEEIRRNTGERINLDRIPLDDEPTCETIRTTHTLGIFQVESPGQMELVGKLQPERFNDLTVDISLFRPGPMKSDMPQRYLAARHGYARPDYIHPRLKPFLWETKGVVVFHEQIMQILDEITGCGLGKADVYRRWLGNPDKMPAIQELVYTRGAERGFPRGVLDKVWNILEGFGSFGFAKAHGAAFALPTYQSAWLKTHHPAEFLAGLLTHDPGMWPKDLLVAETRRLGIPLLPLDVQHSGLDYATEPLPDGRTGIRMALGELMGSSEAERTRIAGAQPFKTLHDFRDQVRPRRTTFENLARVGALDSFIGYERRRRHDLLTYVRSMTASAEQVPHGQLSFDFAVPVPELSGVTALDLHGQRQVDLELQQLGLGVTEHQMQRFHPLFRQLGVVPAKRLVELPDNTEVLIAGVRRATNTPPMRSGKRVVFVSLDDGTGLSNIVFFPDAQERIKNKVFRTNYMLVRGVTRRQGARGISVVGDMAWDLLTTQRQEDVLTSGRVWSYAS